MNTKLHAVTDTIGRPIRFFMTAGQVSDYTGARALVSNLPAAERRCGFDNMVDKTAHYLMNKGGVFYFTRHIPNDLQHHY